MALSITGVACELREVHLRHKPVAMLDASPKGTVPVLVFADGTVIDESIDVVNWALSNGGENIINVEWHHGDQDAIDALIAMNDGAFKYNLDRDKYAARYEDADPLIYRTAGEEFLTILDQRLAKTHWLFGDKISKADIAIFPFIRQFRIADPDWFDGAPYPHLKSWLERAVAMPLFQSIMKKYDRWEDGAPLVTLPLQQ